MHVIYKTLLYIFREKPLKMAFEYLRLGFMKLEEQQLHDALHFLTKAHFQATEAVHTATSFQCLLKAVKMKLTSYTLMEAAVELDGDLKILSKQTFKTLIISRRALFHRPSLPSKKKIEQHQSMPQIWVGNNN